MLEGISATTWFPPQEPAECPVCREARAALSRTGVAAGGDLAIELLATGQVAALLRAVLARLARVVPGGRISLLVPEAAGRWRVFASSAENETLDLVVDSDRYPELMEVRRTGAPYLAPDIEAAPELRDARSLLESAGVKGLAAFPVFAATPGAEPAVLKASFYRTVPADQLALVALAAHQLVHRLFRIPPAEVAAQLGMAAPATGATDPASLLNLLPVPALIVDGGDKVLSANARARRLLRGREPAPGDEPFTLSLVPSDAGEGASRWEAQAAARDGEVHVLAWSSPLPGERRLVLIEPHPEARRRNHERTIRRTLAEKLRELERANTLLAEYARRRDRFVSDAAHELKTPLSILRSYIETLAEDLGAGLSDQQQEFLQAAAVGARRLQRLIDGLLDLAALETGRLPLVLGPVSSREVVAGVVEGLRPIAVAANVGLAAAPAAELALRADLQRLDQVLRNLVENGLKYTPPGGEVTVEVEQRGDRAVICVRDTGVGIPPGILPRIFDEFVRVPGSNLAEGAGLGLAIVRRLALAMGGRVWVESVPDAGSRFFVELPLWTGEG
jgi:signal transduction histidine kinase